MVAVVIDPIICKSDWWWLIPECWGIIPMVGAALGAVLLAALRRRLATSVRMA